MITGPRREQLSVENVLKKVDPYEIYRYYLGQDFKLGRAVPSPFRDDSSPSFSIDNLNIGLHHMDYGDMRWRGSCIDFVMQLYSLDLRGALERINQDFGLGIGSSGKYHIRKAPVIKVPKMEDKRPPLIQVITRSLTREELQYWELHHQGLSDLKAEHIHAPKTIYRNRLLLPQSKYMTFCIYFPEVQAWKLYRPHAPKRGKDTPCQDWKWDTSVPYNYVEGLSSLRAGEDVYLIKSKKDKMVLKKALDISNICVTSSENPACLSEEALKTIDEKALRKIAIWDNDEAGKRFSWYLTKEHGYIHCNVPDIYLEQHGWSDFADWSTGMQDLSPIREHFASKNLLPQLKQTA